MEKIIKTESNQQIWWEKNSKYEIKQSFIKEKHKKYYEAVKVFNKVNLHILKLIIEGPMKSMYKFF
jgi:hypothetical protein